MSGYFIGCNDYQEFKTNNSLESCMDCMGADLKMSEWQFPYDNWNCLEVVVVI